METALTRYGSHSLHRHKLSEDLHELFKAQLTAASKLAVAAFTAQLKKGPLCCLSA